MEGLPPETIHVKRKRGTDDDAVDFLRLERSKRYRSLSGDSSWVYRRKQVGVEHADHGAQPAVPTTPAIPSIQPTEEGEESRLLAHARKAPHGPAANPAVTLPVRASAPPALPAAPVLSHPTTDHLRRFHLSRSNSSQPAPGLPKKRGAPAVFVERNSKKRGESLTTVIQEHNVTHAGPTQASGDSAVARPSSPAAQQPAAKYKKPGINARTKPSTESKPSLPPSMHREGTNMDELSRAMDSWTLSEISKNLEKMDQYGVMSKSSPVMSRFRPKAPKQRYFERHPEQKRVPQQAATAAVMDVDTEDTTDEEDYVIEMYERVPAERLRDQAVPAHRVGLLVFDTEPDMVEFYYGNESDSEEEYLEDDENEDSENHYTTEYPDEDLPWDDEFDRGAYHYMTQNASDLEEFDERDFVDEVDETDFVDDVWERCDNIDKLPG
ncbi:hypothetical protein MFIFM68171_10772 [Madurella fahalii]|uniref:Transcription factor Iwr1 domain-containing protein n=1 Tax=Madurella fahalii TaxID=1157608 RepID=A0ABQ0GS77_9PEZI